MGLVYTSAKQVHTLPKSQLSDVMVGQNINLHKYPEHAGVRPLQGVPSTSSFQAKCDVQVCALQKPRNAQSGHL